jgi:hypothetical protein
LLAGEDEALLVRGNALLVLDLALHILQQVSFGMEKAWKKRSRRLCRWTPPRG